VVTKDGTVGATDVTEAQFIDLGLDNLTTEDVIDLNIALGDIDSLALGTTPNTNLQIILDSLNALDAKSVTLTVLSNIGVSVVIGVSITAINNVLNDTEVSVDDTNGVQAIVDALGRLNAGILAGTDLVTLGITTGSTNLVHINEALNDTDTNTVNNVSLLQNIATAVENLLNDSNTLSKIDIESLTGVSIDNDAELTTINNLMNSSIVNNTHDALEVVIKITKNIDITANEAIILTENATFAVNTSNIINITVTDTT
jgi:hypothetical protein